MHSALDWRNCIAAPMSSSISFATCFSVPSVDHFSHTCCVLPPSLASPYSFKQDSVLSPKDMIHLIEEASEENYVEPGHSYYKSRKNHGHITLSFTTSRSSILI
jgi:hypothetical protein